MNIEEKIKNARLMADNLMKCPANEAYLGHVMEVTAQAIRDLADCIDELDRWTDRPRRQNNSEQKAK